MGQTLPKGAGCRPLQPQRSRLHGGLIHRADSRRAWDLMAEEFYPELA
jgi:hypothetical protein